MGEARILYDACPLCDMKENVEVMLGDCSRHQLYKPSLPAAQRWLSCVNCGHIYTEGYFGPEALAVLFSDTHESQIPGYDIENQRYLWSRVVAAVAALCSGVGNRWLDVGFGNGALLTTAAEYGFEVSGLDLREGSVRKMREFGYNVHRRELAAFTDERLLDVISMADVLEHMQFPRQALDHVWDLMRPEGLLFLSMPNADSFLWKFLDVNGVNPYWGEIEHYHNFGSKRLYALLEECGFVPVSYNVSFRYRAGMEIVARKADRSGRASSSEGSCPEIESTAM